MVGQLDQLFKVKEARGSLDGVHSAKDVIEHFGVGTFLKEVSKSCSICWTNSSLSVMKSLVDHLEQSEFRSGLDTQ
jgi:hypothetical protein